MCKNCNIANICPKCSKRYWDDGSLTSPDLCTCHKLPPPSLKVTPLVGWICPVCGAGVGPFVSICPNEHLGLTSSGTKIIDIKS